MPRRSKRFRAAEQGVDRQRRYALAEAVDLVKAGMGAFQKVKGGL